MSDVRWGYRWSLRSWMIGFWWRLTRNMEKSEKRWLEKAQMNRWLAVELLDSFHLEIYPCLFLRVEVTVDFRRRRIPPVPGNYCRGCGRHKDHLCVPDPRHCQKCGPLLVADRSHCEHCGALLPRKGDDPCVVCGKKAYRFFGK